MECDDYSYTKETWEDFRETTRHILVNWIQNGNFMRWENRAIEQSEENNGYE